MKKVLVISPHPDDETLGCAGTLLAHKENGCDISWVIMTAMSDSEDSSKLDERKKEVQKVASIYDFKSVYELNFETTKLDSLPLSDVINRLSEVFNKETPDTLYVPYRYDAHTDHKVTFDAISACTKSFRSNIKIIRAYETVSETGFSLDNSKQFSPNTWINITDFMEEKIKIMNIYKSEISSHPFPRSDESIRSLAIIRGSQSGLKYAEAFITLKHIIANG